VITAKERTILLITLQTFKIMLKNIYNWKARQEESKVKNREAGFELPSFRNMGNSKALQDFVHKPDKCILVNSGTDGAKLKTMSKAVPDKTLKT
jgi:hypothetical protein